MLAVSRTIYKINIFFIIAKNVLRYSFRIDLIVFNFEITLTCVSYVIFCALFLYVISIVRFDLYVLYMFLSIPTYFYDFILQLRKFSYTRYTIMSIDRRGSLPNKRHVAYLHCISALYRYDTQRARVALPPIAVRI